MLLAIDTATRFASVALYAPTGLLAEASWRSDNNHTIEMLPEIERMIARAGLAPEGLTAVAVCQGPGSFTGLRIGMAIAKGLALALEIPILAIPALEVVAYAAGDPGTRIWSVVELGRGRLCVAPYRYVDGLPQPEQALMRVSAGDWQIETDEPVLVAGEVNADLADHLLSLPNADLLAIPSLAASVRRAGYLAELAWYRLEEGEYDDLDSVAPIYAQQPTSGH